MDRALPAPAVLLTAAAGALHLAVARAHAGEPLLLAGFVLVAVLQLGTVVAERRWPAATREVVIGVNLAAVGAWLASRTVGLPGDAAEPVGAGDLAVVALQLAAVLLVVAPPSRLPRDLAPLATIAALAVVAVVGPQVGHGHEDDAGTVQLGPGDFRGSVAVTDPGGAGLMKDLMTGVTAPLVITSEGRVLGGGPGH